MGDVTFLFIIMLVIAGFAFLPLGYFIMKFSEENGKPFAPPDGVPGKEADTKVNDSELKKMSAFYDFISKLDLEDFDKRKS